MKIKLIMVAVLISTAMFAQVKPKISSAVIAYDKSDLETAKTKMDEAEAELIKVDYRLDDEKTMSKFYFYKGQVYLGILYSTDPKVNGLDENALEKCYDGYMGLLKFEETAKKKRYTIDVIKKLPYVANKYSAKGLELDNANDFVGAKEAFLKAYDIQANPILGDAAKLDTSMLYNAAFMSMKTKDFGGAAELFQKVLDMGYKGIQLVGTSAASGGKVGLSSKEQAEKQKALGMITEYSATASVRPSIYISLIQCYKELEDTEKYKATLAAARKEFPDDIDLINTEIQEYLDSEEYDMALAILDEAIAQSPNNPLYYFVKGNIYLNQKKDGDKALELYAKTFEVDSSYADAMYMSGLVHFNRANDISKEINDLPSSAIKKYDALKKKQKETFALSLPFFEKALEIKPDDEATLKALREVYYKTGDTENFKKVNDQITK